jgi:hypothetical protein
MKLHFGYLLGFSALTIAGCAAVFSVYGIGQLFSGAMIAVIIMASALELGKLVTASYLQRYWYKINLMMKIYLIIGVAFLMAITSGGIYGFLSSAYQETFQKLKIAENEISFLKQKEDFYADDVARYDKELDRISESINSLSKAKVTSIQVRDNNTESGIRNTISTAELRLAQERIAVEEVNRKEIEVKRSVASDSLQKYQMAILNKENDTEVSGELGPLKYIAELTDTGMDEVVNYFILVFIIVFDPLAISLVIATNWVFKEEENKNKEEKNKKVKNGSNGFFKKFFKGKKKPKTDLDGKVSAQSLSVEDLKEAIKKTREQATTLSGKSDYEPNKVIKESITTKNDVNDLSNLNKEIEPVKAESKTNPYSGETKKISNSASGNTENEGEEKKSDKPQGVKTKIKPKQEHKSRFNEDEIKEIRHNARNNTTKIPTNRGY